MKDRGRASYLGPHEMFLLDAACKPIAKAFDDYPYLVGSVMERGDYRDVDVRLMLDDERYAQLADVVAIALLNLTITTYLRRATGLPVDFQIQERSAANELHEGHRNALGLRELGNFAGDGAPIAAATETA